MYVLKSFMRLSFCFLFLIERRNNSLKEKERIPHQVVYNSVVCFVPGCSGGLQLNLQFQTSSPRGLLLYQSGRRSVLALELDDGRVNLIFKRTGELNTLTSPQRVSDAHWHKVQIEMHTNGSVIFYVDTSKITWDGKLTSFGFYE